DGIRDFHVTGVQTCALPISMIVADRFHVVRLVNQHFLKLWQQYDPEGRKNRGLLSLMRRHHWKLSAIQKERLHHYLAQEPVLQRSEERRVGKECRSGRARYG